MIIDDIKLKIEEQRAMLRLIEQDDVDGSSETLISVTRSAIWHMDAAVIELEWLDKYHSARLEAMRGA